MNLGPKPAQQYMLKDIRQLEFQQEADAKARRLVWLGGLTSVSVALLAAVSLMGSWQGPADAQRAGAMPEQAAPAIAQDTVAVAAAPESAAPDTYVLASVRPQLRPEPKPQPAPAAEAPEPAQQLAELADAPERDAACAQELAAVAHFSTIYFEVGSVLLDVKALHKARQVVEAVEMCPGVTLQVWGHADGSGDDATNVKLSQKRAQNTMTAIRAMGFDTSAIELKAAGAQQPIAQGDTDDALDRRVEFRVVKTQP